MRGGGSDDTHGVAKIDEQPGQRDPLRAGGVHDNEGAFRRMLCGGKAVVQRGVAISGVDEGERTRVQRSIGGPGRRSRCGGTIDSDGAGGGRNCTVGQQRCAP